MTRSRLISAERLAVLAGGTAAPWAFERMDAPPPAMVEEEGPPPEPPIDIEALLAEACAQAYAEGHAAGAAEAREQADEAMRALTEGQLHDQAQRFATMLDAAREGLDAAQQDIARGTLDIACALARQVLRQELATRPELLEPVVREAIDLLVADGRSVRVVLSPDDHAWLAAALEQEFASRGLTVVAESAMMPGDCRLESAGAVVDGGIAPRWARAVASLGLTVPWQAADGDAPASAAAPQQIDREAEAAAKAPPESGHQELDGDAA